MSHLHFLTKKKKDWTKCELPDDNSAPHLSTSYCSLWNLESQWILILSSYTGEGSLHNEVGSFIFTIDKSIN